VIHGRAVNPARIVLPLVASLPLLVLAALALTASLLRLSLVLSWLLTSGMATTTAPALAGRPGRVVTWIHRFLSLLNCVNGEPFCGFAGFVAAPCHTVARSKAFLQFDPAGSKPCWLKHSSDQATGRTAEAALPEKPVMRLNGQFLFA
jgi:hypothetical protein